MTPRLRFARLTAHCGSGKASKSEVKGSKKMEMLVDRVTCSLGSNETAGKSVTAFPTNTALVRYGTVAMTMAHVMSVLHQVT